MLRFTNSLFAILSALALLTSAADAQVGNDNPTGTSGQFNGNSTTGSSYDPYTANATRSVTDVVVAGGVSSYPLAFTRTMNSRYTPGAGEWEMGESGSWRHSYQWSVDVATSYGSFTALPDYYTVNYPDGRRITFQRSGSDSYFRGPGG